MAPLTLIASLTLAAFSAASALEGPNAHKHTGFAKRALGKEWTGSSSFFTYKGGSGIGAMQIAVISEDQLVIFDKAEHNTLHVDGHAAWGAVMKISNGKIRPIQMRTNSFCAGGAILANGTLVSVGGNPLEGNISPGGTRDGLTAVRLFNFCDERLEKCPIFDDPSKISLKGGKRWYPSALRLQDGSVMILGGMTAGGYNNKPDTDNPTIEYFPPKFGGAPIYSRFLHDALNTNLFPIVYALPNDQVFVYANHIAMLYSWRTNTEHRIAMPKGMPVFNYPASAAACLLPLTIKNNWTPEVFFFGGTNAYLDDAPWKLSSQTAASSKAYRLVLSPAGLQRGWQVENGPEARVIASAVVMPDMKILIVNGAKTGVSGYGNTKQLVGQSNADNPNYRPTLYDPEDKGAARWNTKFPSSKIERLYHNTATLTPAGTVLIMGGNPNADVSLETYMTRYTIEEFRPPYYTLERPAYSGEPKTMDYGRQYKLQVKYPKGTKKIQAVLVDLGYSTHAVYMDNRLVELKAATKGLTQRSGEVTIEAPANSGLFPPGKGFIYILADGVPSKARMITVGRATY